MKTNIKLGDKKSKKVLLVVPPSTTDAYSKSKIRAAIPEIPLLSVASLAASLLEAGHIVRVADLSITNRPKRMILKEISSFRPDYVGLTFTTPLYNEAMVTAEIVKKFDPNIIVMCGGVHSTAVPEEVVQNPNVDIVAIGEADITIADIVSGKRLESIDGICYMKNGRPVRTKPRELIQDINKLPFPAWHLYDVKKYKTPALTSRKNPVGPIQTSRGCVFGCTFCNKNIFGRKIRMMSVTRVVDEMEHLLKSGFREIHVWDDNFNTDLKRAKGICDEIIRRKLKFPWNLFVGIRVDCVDQEFFYKAKKAGCYQIGLGIESGNQELLDNINKGTKLWQIRDAVRMAKKAGLELVGFFMLALPGETEETMKKTIEFAKELDLDYAKATVTLPFPSTPLYNQLKAQGKIKTQDWRKYNFHHTSDIYDHPNLDWPTINRYYDRFFREFYFRPKYLFRRIANGLLNGRVFTDFYYFLKTWGPL